jgi:uncharacterized protein YggE
MLSTRLLPGLVLAAIALAGAGGAPGLVAAQASSPRQPHVRTVTVSGDGEARAAPDVAYVSVGVQAEAATAQQASDDASRRMAAVLAALRARGVPGPALQTSGLALSPQVGKDAQDVTGYQATNSVTSTVDALERAGELLDAALSAGANRVGGLRVGIKDPAPLRTQALTEAAQAARAKADTLAAALGLRVVGVEQVTEAGLNVPQPLAMADTARAATPAALAPPVEPGELRVTARVGVAFRVE